MNFDVPSQINPVKRPWTAKEEVQVFPKKQRSIGDDEEQDVTNCVENLPTEIFLDIFDYLEGGELYNAFTKLNVRFERLLDASNLLLRTYLKPKEVTSPEDYYNELIVPNKHRIRSLELCFSWCPNFVCSRPFIDTSFTRLQSFRVHFISEASLISLLVVLANMPRLTSLYLGVIDDLKDITYIYQQIFTMPSIRFLDLSMSSSEGTLASPMPMAEQCNQIESLGFEDDCTVNDLLTLLSYTPRLRRLTCSSIIESEVTMAPERVTAIPSLTHIRIYTWEADFRAFETVITNIAPELRYLYISCSRAPDFLNAEQWERVLSQHLSNLTRLDFTYEEPIHDHFVVTQHHEHIHRFSSPFWVKKNWLFTIRIDIDDLGESIVSYKIYPGQKTNLIVIDQDLLPSFPTILSEGNRLSIAELPEFDDDESCIELVGPMLLSSNVTCLNIDISEVFAELLVDLIQYLPDLDSLVIKSIAPIDGEQLSVEEAEDLRLSVQTRSITKVRLTNLSSLNEIQFLIDLCPWMQYLQIDHTNDIDLELLVRFILSKDSKDLPSLFFMCLGSPTSTGPWLERLDQMIGGEQLRRDYAIEEIQEKIYLRWTLQ